ncbi:MAG: S8 family peptidase [bacterium]|nr:S8 family peptidase [bacterium]
MERYKHLPLPEYRGNLEKRKKDVKGGGFKFPEGREKKEFYQNNLAKATEISESYKKLKSKFQNKIDPNLIFRIKINQSVDVTRFDTQTLHPMGMEVLSIAPDKKGYWIVFASDEKLENFKKKLTQHSEVERGRYDFFNAIDGIDDIPAEEKKGPLLRKKPLDTQKTDYLNIELWRMENERLNKFIQQLKKTYPNPGEFRISDQLITRSFALLRVKLTKKILDEILELKEIARVDRPFIPLFKPCEYRKLDVSELEINPPGENATGILVVDSGIVSNHPLLEKSVGGEENFQDEEEETYDTVGHGTAVSGCAVYGDIDHCIDNKSFASSNWLFSAKVMFAEEDQEGNIIQSTFDPEKLLEHQLDDAIRSFLDNNEYKIKVVNISFGNAAEIWQKTTDRQFPLASLIDDIAFDYPEVVFIVSAGNQNPRKYFENLADIIDNYPNFLIDNPDFKIINPATSALSLTVGSIAPSVRIFDDGHTAEDIWKPIAKENEPSPFTRTGGGLNGMVKPELVEYGGNLILGESFNRIAENSGGKITLLSNKPTEELFTFDYGTSFSAPKIAHLAGKIANQFPDKSANFIKNLILLSTGYKDKVIPSFHEDKDKEKSMLQVEGYGLPDYERAIYSYENRVVLFNEGEIGLDKVQVFSLNIPSIYFETEGYKKISIVLTFNPSVRATRGDSYLGNRMEFNLFHSVSPDEIIDKYAEIDISTEDESIPEELKKFKIDMKPGANTRKAGCHQKAWKEFKREPKNPIQAPISLVLINSNKWIPDEKYLQPYCISLIVEHSKNIEIYNLLRNEVQERTRVGVRG